MRNSLWKKLRNKQQTYSNLLKESYWQSTVICTTNSIYEEKFGAMRKRGLLVVLSGPAGSGKSTLAEKLIARHSDSICRAVTSTTRHPRPGEENGVDYYFLSKEEFESGIIRGDFVEHTTFNCNYYGTGRAALHEKLDQGKTVMLVIEVQGASAIREAFPHSAHIFVLPPSREELRKRLHGRGTECHEDVEKRLAIAEKEIQELNRYDFLVINDDLDAAVTDLDDIVRIARLHHLRGDELDAWESGRYRDWHTSV